MYIHLWAKKFFASGGTSIVSGHPIRRLPCCEPNVGITPIGHIVPGAQWWSKWCMIISTNNSSSENEVQVFNSEIMAGMPGCRVVTLWIDRTRFVCFYQAVKVNLQSRGNPEITTRPLAAETDTVNKLPPALIPLLNTWTHFKLGLWPVDNHTSPSAV